jgi:hypothetical protein
LHTLPSQRSQKVSESRTSLNVTNEFVIASLWQRTYVVAIWSHDDSQFGRVMSRIIYGRQWPLLVVDNHHGMAAESSRVSLSQVTGARKFHIARALLMIFKLGGRRAWVEQLGDGHRGGMEH